MEKISTLDLSAIPDTQEVTTAMNHWFSSETGIYNSKHKPIQLPKTQFLDVVSFIFSHKHDGVSALIDSQSGFEISYTKLQQMVKSMASGLHEIGICRGDVVLILLPNTIFFPVIFLGILSIGAIATTMNPLSSFSEINKQISGCNVAMVFTVNEKLMEIENLGVRVVEVPVTLDSYSSSSDFSSFDKILSSNPDFAPMPVIDQQDTAAILYSSGTSGPSKGVILSHSNLISVVEHFVRFEAFQYENLPSSKNVYLDVVPMFHCYGLSLFVMGLFSLGSTVVVMRKFDLVELVRAINKYNVTHLPVVPPILIALTKVKAFGNCELRSLKQVSCGAAPVSKKTIREFIQSYPHVDFIQGYGMTESTAVGTRGFNTDYIRKYMSVGLLAPNMQAKVVDWNTGSCMPPGNSGELWLRGPGIMKGYLNDEDATRSAVNKDGWLRTGDIAHFDYDGYLYILDRLKDTIKYNGFQISPADLEAVLISHPEILDVAVTAARNDEVGEVPVAFVVRRDGSEVSQADVINYVAAQVSPYKKVRKVVFTQSIPKSAAGKVLRRKLRDSLVSKI